jgi:hypothetical protein
MRISEETMNDLGLAAIGVTILMFWLIFVWRKELKMWEVLVTVLVSAGVGVGIVVALPEVWGYFLR